LIIVIACTTAILILPESRINQIRFLLLLLISTIFFMEFRTARVGTSVAKALVIFDEAGASMVLEFFRTYITLDNRVIEYI
jgi:hypothetical protein